MFAHLIAVIALALPGTARIELDINPDIGTPLVVTSSGAVLESPFDGLGPTVVYPIDDGGFDSLDPEARKALTRRMSPAPSGWRGPTPGRSSCAGCSRKMHWSARGARGDWP